MGQTHEWTKERKCGNNKSVKSENWIIKRPHYYVYNVWIVYFGYCELDLHMERRTGCVMQRVWRKTCGRIRRGRRRRIRGTLLIFAFAESELNWKIVFICECAHNAHARFNLNRRIFSALKTSLYVLMRGASVCVSIWLQTAKSHYSFAECAERRWKRGPLSVCVCCS